jgi:branched-chain amino acid transport system substrate-binding protein
MENGEKMPFNAIPAISRRQFIVRSTGLAVGSMSIFQSGYAQTKDTVKIGLVLAKQGPFAQQAAEMAQGVNFALEGADHSIQGKPAQIVWLDEADSQAAIQSFYQLVEEQHVVAVLGGVNSVTSRAMGDLAQGLRTPFISINGMLREKSGQDCNPFAFWQAPSIAAYAQAMAPYMLTKGKRWYFLADPFAMGDDVIAAFTAVLKEAEGTVAGVERIPVPTLDYNSFILKARAARPNVLISSIPRVEPLLVKMQELNLMDKILFAAPAVSDSDLWSVQSDALAGIYAKPWHYSDPTNSSEEKSFVKNYTAKNDKPPSDRVFLGWQAMRLLLAAAARAKSTEPAMLAQSLTTMPFRNGRLPLRFRGFDHQLIRRPIVGIAHANAQDKWDVLNVKSKALSQSALERLYEPKEEVVCPTTR